jgi:hypothetical protein
MPHTIGLEGTCEYPYGREKAIIQKVGQGRLENVCLVYLVCFVCLVSLVGLVCPVVRVGDGMAKRADAPPSFCSSSGG